MQIKSLNELPLIKTPLKPEKPVDHSIGFFEEGLHYAFLRRRYLLEMRKYKNELRLYYRKIRGGNDVKE